MNSNYNFNVTLASGPSDVTVFRAFRATQPPQNDVPQTEAEALERRSFVFFSNNRWYMRYRPRPALSEKDMEKQNCAICFESLVKSDMSIFPCCSSALVCRECYHRGHDTPSCFFCKCDLSDNMAIAVRRSTNDAGKRKREEEEDERNVKKAIALSLREESVPQSPIYPQEDDIPEDFWGTQFDETESQPIIPLRNSYLAAPAPVSVSVSVSVSQVPSSVLSPFDQFMARNHPESLTARSLNRTVEPINPSVQVNFSSRFQDQITRLHPRESFSSTSSNSDTESNDEECSFDSDEFETQTEI